MVKQHRSHASTSCIHPRCAPLRAGAAPTTASQKRTRSFPENAAPSPPCGRDPGVPPPFVGVQVPPGHSSSPLQAGRLPGEGERGMCVPGAGPAAVSPRPPMEQVRPGPPAGAAYHGSRLISNFLLAVHVASIYSFPCNLQIDIDACYI